MAEVMHVAVAGDKLTVLELTDVTQRCCDVRADADSLVAPVVRAVLEGTVHESVSLVGQSYRRNKGQVRLTATHLGLGVGIDKCDTDVGIKHS